MLSALRPPPSHPCPLPSHAYEVPWHIDRLSDTHPVVVNRSREPARFVRVFGSDGTTQRWGELAPGDSFDLCLCGSDLDDLVMTLCWVRGDTGVEYVWRFVM